MLRLPRQPTAALLITQPNRPRLASLRALGSILAEIANAFLKASVGLTARIPSGGAPRSDVRSAYPLTLIALRVFPRGREPS